MSKPRVTGVGGIFVKSRDPAALSRWYAEQLGVKVESWGGAQFLWKQSDGGDGSTVWNPFSETTSYFAPSERPFMLNLLVDDLDGMLAQLKSAGAQVLDCREEGEQGKFGYVVDPDGTLIELWEPAPTSG